MRLAYLDAFAGVSGDMLLGAFIHAGVPVQILHEALMALNLGASLVVEDVDRSGIRASKAHVLVDGKPADASLSELGHAHAHHHDSSSNNGHSHAQEIRSLASIRALISKAELPEAVKILSIRAFELLGEAEAKIHHVPIESIHFHEVGAVDSIADIVLSATAACSLKVDAWYCSPLNVGGGTIECVHGRFPVPAPATMELLRDAPTYSSGIEAELVTPTGAALVRALGCVFAPQPPFKINAIGYGAGTRNPAGFANVLRLTVGESTENSLKSETVWVMEAAVDDLNPQVIAYVTEKALALGALDVMCSSVFMKKNRPGILLTVLSDRSHLQQLEELLLRETSTLGLRVHEEKRIILERKFVDVLTEWGPVKMKVGHRDGTIYNVSPEFDDCRVLAESKGIPVKLVIEAAVQSYRQKVP
jgi:uncharacterized protein (TIGR00299 family) protein